MLTPGIYYANRNSTRQLIKILPGVQVYPRDTNLFPYVAPALDWQASTVYRVGDVVRAPAVRTVLYTCTAAGTSDAVEPTWTTGIGDAITDGPVSWECVSLSAFPRITYVNSNIDAPIGSTVSIEVDGTVIGTPAVFNAEGTYAIDFIPPLGTFKLKCTYADNSSQVQHYRSVNLHTALDTLGEQYKDLKVQSLIAPSALYATFHPSGIFRSQAGDPSLVSWGDLSGFIRPSDWTLQKYSEVLSAFLAALPKGSTTGAVKDIVQAVTGNTVSDQDFRLLQSKLRWHLPSGVSSTYLTGNRYRYDGGVVDADPTDIYGPHHFLVSDRAPANVLATPIAVLDSDIRRAFTILLRVVTDGFLVEEGEVVTRSTLSNIDKLQYSWLNPWAHNHLIVHPTGYQLFEAWVDAPHAISKSWDIGGIPPVGEELVFLNGLELSDADYTLLGSVLTLNPAVLVEVDDYVQVAYVTAGPTKYHEEFTFTGSYTFTTANFPLPVTLDVFVNGKRLDASVGEYSFVAPDQVVIDPTKVILSLVPASRIDIAYCDSGTNQIYEDSATYLASAEPVFSTAHAIVDGSISVYINGVKAPLVDSLNPTYYIALNGVDIVIDYARLGVVDGDRIMVTCEYAAIAGANVLITQGATIYTQGYNFQVNYTTGEVIWDITKPNPVAGTGYMAYYIYFPKDILDVLLGTVKPATMRLFLEFETTAAQAFRPYFWNGAENVTGDVIL